MWTELWGEDGGEQDRRCMGVENGTEKGRAWAWTGLGREEGGARDGRCMACMGVDGAVEGNKAQPRSPATENHNSQYIITSSIPYSKQNNQATNKKQTKQRTT